MKTSYSKLNHVEKEQARVENREEKKSFVDEEIIFFLCLYFLRLRHDFNWWRRRVGDEERKVSLVHFTEVFHLLSTPLLSHFILSVIEAVGKIITHNKRTREM